MWLSATTTVILRHFLVSAVLVHRQTPQRHIRSARSELQEIPKEISARLPLGGYLQLAI